jgi:hypothetical protein
VVTAFLLPLTPSIHVSAFSQRSTPPSRLIVLRRAVPCQRQLPQEGADTASGARTFDSGAARAHRVGAATSEYLAATRPLIRLRRSGPVQIDPTRSAVVWTMRPFDARSMLGCGGSVPQKLRPVAQPVAAQSPRLRRGVRRCVKMAMHISRRGLWSTTHYARPDVRHRSRSDGCDTSRDVVCCLAGKGRQ